MTNPSSTVSPAILSVALTGMACAALLLGGCQGDASDSERTGTPPEAEQKPSGRKVEPSNSSESSDDTKRVRAADGTDLDACRDADCQVELGTGDVLRPEVDGLPLDTITLEKIGADRVELAMAGRTGQGMTLEGVDINISSKCVGERCSDSGELTVTTETSGKINHIGVRLDQVREGRAVLTFEPDPEANSGSGV